MDKSSLAIFGTLGLCVISAVGDYFIKLASNQQSPFMSAYFVVGLMTFAATAFGWVYVMRHLTFASIGVVYAVGSILTMVLVGTVFLGETLRWQEGIGIGFALVSIGLLARFA